MTPGVDLGQLPESHDDAREHDDREIRLVLLHARVAQRQNFVGRGGEAHHAAPVQRARFVDIALRQLELDFRAESQW